MKIDSALLDTLSAQAKANPRLRQAYDLRTPSTSSGQAQPEDNSQRILNAMESGTVILEYKDGRYEVLGEEDILII